jgi:transposase
MNEGELKRGAVLSQVAEKDWTLVQAAARMGLSYRQAKRLWKRYGAQGTRGLMHGKVGRRSNHAKPQRLRRRVLVLIRRKYGGEAGERFGPTRAAEHLEEDDGIVMGVETLRQWMLEEGLWSRERRGRAHRRRRERKAHLGELVQLDGSFHDWLERGPPVLRSASFLWRACRGPVRFAFTPARAFEPPQGLSRSAAFVPPRPCWNIH